MLVSCALDEAFKEPAKEAVPFRESLFWFTVVIIINHFCRTKRPFRDKHFIDTASKLKRRAFFFRNVWMSQITNFEVIHFYWGLIGNKAFTNSLTIEIMSDFFLIGIISHPKT